jgi:hypothetical protein
MKALSKLVLASVLLVLLVAPSTSMSDRMPAPIVQVVEPGQSTILYAGQSLRFTTDVPLKLSLTPLEPGRIHMKVKAIIPRGGGGNAPASGSEIVEIFWLNWDNEIYDGPPPENPWEGILLTESGFTEK